MNTRINTKLSVYSYNSQINYICHCHNRLEVHLLLSEVKCPGRFSLPEMGVDCLTAADCLLATLLGVVVKGAFRDVQVGPIWDLRPDFPSSAVMLVGGFFGRLCAENSMLMRSALLVLCTCLCFFQVWSTTTSPQRVWFFIRITEQLVAAATIVLCHTQFSWTRVPS